jgi:tRNA C32,U32 (ribose-2'-O)-methylase TrmJ
VVETLPAAVADCHLVVGTTCRTGGYRTEIEDLATLAPAIVERAAAGPVAIVFGPEDHGLSNTDLRHCQRLCAIDTSDEYASLNLAQAVLLVCWELRRAARDAMPAPAPVDAARPARSRRCSITCRRRCSASATSIRRIRRTSCSRCAGSSAGRC